MNIPNVSVAVDITNIAGVRLGAKGGTGAINFDVKARLEEKERKSQMVTVGFNLFLTTKPNAVKFEVEGTATLTGKEVEINKMLEVDPEIKVPYVFQKVYQDSYAAMYLLSTILKAPPPPHNLFSLPQTEGIATEDVDVESRVGEVVTEEAVEQKIGESSSIESRETVTQGSAEEGTEESATTESVESKAEEAMMEKRVEERTEALSNTER